jgi:NDP-sugar pyrophosphorylase family protein
MDMQNSITKAMILAAGEGTRLRPLTLKTPKAMLPVGETPLVVHQLAWLKSHGISEVAINLYHLGDKVIELLGNGSRFGIEIIYSREEKLLGTAGGVKRMESFFDGTFVVVYGDVLTDFNLSRMLKFHHEKHSLATIALMPVAAPSEVGVVELNNEGRINSFIEKPPPGYRTSNLANCGIYVLEKAVLQYIPSDGFYDFGFHIFPKMLQLDLPVYGYVLEPRDYLCDIGVIDRYQIANEDMRAGKVKINCG